MGIGSSAIITVALDDYFGISKKVILSSAKPDREVKPVYSWTEAQLRVDKNYNYGTWKNELESAKDEMSLELAWARGANYCEVICKHKLKDQKSVMNIYNQKLARFTGEGYSEIKSEPEDEAIEDEELSRQIELRKQLQKPAGFD